MSELPLESGDLAAALQQTASVQPEVMPTADILQQERLGDKGENEKVPENGQEKRGRGRPRKDTTDKPAKTKSIVGGVKTAAQQQETQEAAQRVELAKQCIGLLEQSGTIIAGEAAKMGETERDALCFNLDNYLKAKNINDIPPGLMLTLGITMYYGRVLQTPVGDDKVPVAVRWYYKAKNWFNKMIGRKYAHPDNWSDRQRENDTGEKANTSPKK